MSSDSRYVFDVNVIVSALLFNDSVPGRVFFQALESSVILISPSLVSELIEVLRRPKFSRYVTWEERERLLLALISDAELVPVSSTLHACSDPDDNHVLELAVDGGATLIVTGDRDLLSLASFRGVPIVTPAEAIESMEQRPKDER